MGAILQALEDLALTLAHSSFCLPDSPDLTGSTQGRVGPQTSVIIQLEISSWSMATLPFVAMGTVLGTSGQAKGPTSIHIPTRTPSNSCLEEY